MRSSLIVALLVGLVVSSVFAFEAVRAGSAFALTRFDNEIVDANGDVGSFTSLTLDPLGHPVVAYYDASGQDLKYARKTGAVWSVERVGFSTNDEGWHASLVLDAQNVPHIAYGVIFPSGGARISYASKFGGVWTSEYVIVSGFYMSLALDSGGNPRIGFRNMTFGKLGYAWKSGASWTIEIADGANNDLGWYTSLKLDAQGNPHLSYYDHANGNLKYAVKSGGGWTIETADSALNDVGSYSSLALDAQENPHIGYLDRTARKLKYAWKSGGIWTIEVADWSANDVGWNLSLALDSQGSAHISHRDVTAGDLKYARKSGGGWTNETADDSPNHLGLYTSITIDGNGNPHISYYDLTAGDLKYAKLKPVTTAVSGLASLDAVGRDDAIEVKWTVRSRDEYLGFNILRSEDGGSFVQQTDEMIPNAAETFPATLSWLDATVREGIDYAYRIEVIHPDGMPEIWGETVTARIADRAPTEYALRVEGPNPVRADFGVKFAFDVPRPGAVVSLAAYDLGGRRISTLVDGPVGPGTHAGEWRRPDLERFASGVYFLRLDAGDAHRTRRLILLR